jgi:hypothetical protein
MDSTQDQPANFRTPERWNSVNVPERVAMRAIENVDKQADGCWISRYSVASHGYSQIGWQDAGSRHVVLGHRAAWVAMNGQVPLGMTLDHTCKQKRCVNPTHLRLLPNYENARRTAGRDWPIGYCANGHDATHLIEVTRSANASGKATICGTCTNNHRRAWVERNPERRRVSQRRYEAKRRVVRAGQEEEHDD